MKNLRLLPILLACSAGLFAQSTERLNGSPDSAQALVRHAGAAGPNLAFTAAGNEAAPAAPVSFAEADATPKAKRRNPLLRILGFRSKPSPAARIQLAAEVVYHGPLGHPFEVVARHADGAVFYSYHGFNMRTSAGTSWQSQMLGDTSTPSVNAQCNYVGLTNTGITPAEADTTLSGEIASNGLSRAQATYADASTTLTVPSAPSVTPTGTAGSTTYFYWVYACNQGICSTASSSGTTTTSNATLSSSNYNLVTWTPITGAATYQLARTATNSAPSGTVSDLVGNAAACTTAICTQLDTSNTLSSFTAPSSNLTNFGQFTLAKTFTATGTQSAQAFGVFTAASSGTMCFEGIFSTVSLINGDQVAFTEKVNF